MRLQINPDAMLELYMIHGSGALDSFLDAAKEEFYREILMMKVSGKYQESKDKLDEKLMKLATKLHK